MHIRYSDYILVGIYLKLTKNNRKRKSVVKLVVDRFLLLVGHFSVMALCLYFKFEFIDIINSENDFKRFNLTFVVYTRRSDNRFNFVFCYCS